VYGLGLSYDKERVMGSNAANMKPDGQRVNRAKPAFDWVSLPASGRAGAAPALPDMRPWMQPTLDAWASVWSSPQATQWDQTGRTLHTWAVLHHDLTAGGRAMNSVSAEMRQHEDRHGLNPKALLQLRWRIVDENGEQVRPNPSKGARVTRMRVVDPDAVA
jgi:hypothetical protein